MTADEFIAWAMARPETEHYELIDGEVIAMAPERIGHARVKFRIVRHLAEALEAARLPCEVLIDRVSLRADPNTVYEPDVMVRCGDPLDPDLVEISDPIIVVEVVSRSSRGADKGAKLDAYFRLPSVQHYVMVNADRRVAVHHRRSGVDAVTTQIIRAGPIELDPPGVVIEAPFPPERGPTRQ
jgi:Uma2 family endonuclease